MSNNKKISELDRVAVFDTETTGVGPDARIVTAYLATLDRAGNVLEEHDFLINPGIDIPQGAIDVHGITNERAQADGADSRESVAQITRLLNEASAAGIPIVAYNGAFDVTVTNAEAQRHGVGDLRSLGTVIDPYVIDKKLEPFRRGPRKLTNVTENYGVSLDNAHTADADAISAGLVAWKMLDKLAEKEGDLTMDQLHGRQTRWAAKQAAGLQAYFRDKGAGDENVDWRWPLREGEAINDLPWNKWYEARGMQAPTDLEREDRHAELVAALNGAVAQHDPDFAGFLDDLDAGAAAKKIVKRENRQAEFAADRAERAQWAAAAETAAAETRAVEAADAAFALASIAAAPEQERLAGLWIDPAVDRAIDAGDQEANEVAADEAVNAIRNLAGYVGRDELAASWTDPAADHIIDRADLGHDEVAAAEAVHAAFSLGVPGSPSGDQHAANWSDPAVDDIIDGADQAFADAWHDPEMDAIIDQADAEIQGHQKDGKWDFKRQSSAQAQVQIARMSAEERAVLADTIGEVTWLMGDDDSNNWETEIDQLNAAANDPLLLTDTINDVTSYMLSDKSNDWSEEVQRLRSLVTR